MQRSPISFVVFFAVLCALIGGIHFYIWYRLVQGPVIDLRTKRILTLAIAGLAVFLPLGIVLSRQLGREKASIVAFAAYTWMGIAIVCFFILLSFEAVRLAKTVIEWLNKSDPDLERRAVVVRGFALLAAVLTGGVSAVGIVSALGLPEVREVSVRLTKLPSKLRGLRIVQLTDIHIGPTIGGDWLRQVVERVNALNPDLVAITGDLVDGSVAELRSHVAPLGELRSKYGTFFVTGNHEYYSGVDEWSEYLRSLGIKVLQNERVTIGEGSDAIDLAGVDDYAARKLGKAYAPDLEKALRGRDESRPVVLLAHQPKHAFEASKHGVALQLSGHTHGGQIFPWGLFVRFDQPVVAGLGEVDGTQVYVSRGTGYWGPPMRVAAPSEISLITLDA